MALNTFIEDKLRLALKSRVSAQEVITAINNGIALYTAQGSTSQAALASVNTFRLSGATATPVMSPTQGTCSTVYLAQCKGNAIALYDGTSWAIYSPSSEISLAVTGRTAGIPFDVFAYVSAGTVTLEFLDWTSATARATGLTRQDGVWTKTGDATRRYLGTIRARGATSFKWLTEASGAPAQNAGPAALDLFNADNRVRVGFYVWETTDTWNYTTATIRQANGAAGNQVDICVGLAEESIDARVAATSRNSTASILRYVGIGEDTTSAFTFPGAETSGAAAINSHAVASASRQPAIGVHYYAWLEHSAASGVTTWVGDDGAALLQSGLFGTWTC